MKDFKKGQGLKKIFIFMVLIAMAFLMFSFIAPERAKADELDNTLSSDYSDTAFHKTYNKWLKEGKRVINLSSPLSFGAPSIENKEAYERVEKNSKSFFKIEKGESLKFTINVQESGLYEIGLNYLLLDEFYTNPLIECLVNGEVEFSESSSISLEVLWEVDPNEDKHNRYGDEMHKTSRPYLDEYEYYFEDEKETYSTKYKYLLSEGENVILISSITHTLYISSLQIFNEKELESFASYDLSKSSSTKAITILEGEDFIYKNSLSIKQAYYKDPGCTPFEYKNKVMNILDSGSVSDGGSYVNYKFDVSESGYYYIAFKYLHDSNLGVVSSRNIYIDGEIPYKELKDYMFVSSRKWKNEYLCDDNGNYLKVYLEKGSHTMTLETSLSYSEEIRYELQSIMGWINDTSLKIKVITGGETSSIITQYITKYLPNLESDLLYYSNRLTEIYDLLNSYDTGIKNSAPELTCLNIASKNLKKLAKKVNRINSKLGMFSDGSGSAYELIGSAITSLSSSPMDIDRIYFVGCENEKPLKAIPKARTNFFKRMFIAIASFFYSFTDERYKLKNAKDDKTINVWVEQSSLYTDIIQNMADEHNFDFNVKINVLPSVSKLILSHSTNENPDVVLSLDTWEPYSMALRGMLEDLSKYDGFNESIKDIESGNFAPLIFEDGIYAIPETTSAFLLYYRKDILDSLNLDIPDTWSDVIEMLYTIQSYSMNFYHPMSADTSYKSFGMVTPFFYQFGAEVYSEDSSISTLEDEKTLEAMKFITELYTVYNLPRQVSSFFESFRSGLTPIGVSSIDLYLQLEYAAPEISGQWGVTVLPGIKNKEGEVERWSACYGKCSVIFSNSKHKNEAWQFIKWWNSLETQIEYTKNIKTTLGERYLVVPANLKALKASVWDAQIKDVIVEQAKWSMVPAVTPGSYIVEREISQIWNKVVIDKVPLRQAISESVPKINRELVRKLDEFGYIDKDGKSTYRVALKSNINEILKRNKK